MNELDAQKVLAGYTCPFDGAALVRLFPWKPFQDCPTRLRPVGAHPVTAVAGVGRSNQPWPTAERMPESGAVCAVEAHGLPVPHPHCGECGAPAELADYGWAVFVFCTQHHDQRNHNDVYVPKQEPAP